MKTPGFSLRTGKLNIFLLLAALLGLAQPVVADSLVPHTATYKVKISIASGILKTSVRETDNGFEAQSVIRPTGLARLLTSGTIEETSTFVAGPDGVQPLEYVSRDSVSSDKTQMDFAFDWDASVVTGTVNDTVFEYPLDQEVHDRVSIQYQLMHNLMTNSGSSEYAMLDDDELKQISIRTVGEKEIKVPYGRFKAIGIQHQAAGSKRITTLWCAEELGYLPVMIEQRRKGKLKGRLVLAAYKAGQPGESAISAAN